MPSAHRYAELHAHSAYSFLDGANEPEDLAAAAAELGLEALALTDHDGMPGIVKHARAGRAHGVPTIHGAELALDDASHLPILARDPRGYRRLAAAVSHHNLAAGRREEPSHRLPELAAALEGGGILALTGTANGPLRRALGDPHRPTEWSLVAADAALGRLVDLLGPDGVAVELSLDGSFTDAPLTEALGSLARATACRSWPPAPCAAPARRIPAWPMCSSPHDWPPTWTPRADTCPLSAATCAAPSRWRACTAVIRPPSTPRRISGRTWPSTSPSSSPTCPSRPSPRGTPRHLAPRAHPARRPGALRLPGRGARGLEDPVARARRHRVPRLPRILPHRALHRRLLR
ncbi:error-prone DNA polymerase [Actinomyces denticolens]|nr:error-prone DNA polymerase [Actinomyces denticolens]